MVNVADVLQLEIQISVRIMHFRPRRCFQFEKKVVFLYQSSGRSTEQL